MSQYYVLVFVTGPLVIEKTINTIYFAKQGVTQASLEQLVIIKQYLSCILFVLICTVVALYCFVMCGCVYVWVL